MSWRIPVILAAALAAVVPLPAALVERWFSSGVYPVLQSFVTAASNWLPFLLLDLVIFASAAVAVLAVRATARRPGSLGTRAARAVAALLGIAAVLYLAFVALWGLNYQREPLAARLDFDRSRITPEAARGLLDLAVARLNDGYAAAHADAWPTLAELPDRLGPAFAATERLIGAPRPVTPGVPKATLLAPYFRWTGVDGFTNPFGLDIAVVPDLPAVERPSVVAHEWAHLAGFADEAEASFLAWLICQHGDAWAQYSGWLSVLGHVAAAVPRDPRREALSVLGDGPRRDLAEIAERHARTRPALRFVAWRIYDRFLRVHHVEEGAASYGLVAELLLGTRLQALDTATVR